MTRTLLPHHPVSPIREEDLYAFAHLVPPSGVRLLALLGVHDGLRLLNVWPGVQIVVPKGPCNNAGGARRWAQIVAIVGAPATLKLADKLGGECLDVPTLDDLRKERRNSVIRAQFDQLTASAPHGQGLSKAAAVLELNLLHAPITWRQLEIIIDRPVLKPLQPILF
ncbi:MAG: hypothetical protein NTZ64_15175 [Polaromonas sp.]|nr:hypothetical protein [Polaromonas sp.]